MRKQSSQTGAMKKTEIGLLPVEWNVERLGDVGKIIMGQSPPGKSYNENGSGFPFLQGKAEFGFSIPRNIKFTTEPKKFAYPENILMSVRAPVGDVNIADKKYCIGRGLVSLSLKKGKNLFLFYLLKFFKPQIEKEGYGSTFKAINKSQLQKFAIPLPPLAEQENIASVLSSLQNSIEKTEDVIKSLWEFKKSMMRHLFTYGPVSAEKAEQVKLQETEIGMIPEGWDVVMLGEVSHLERGRFAHRPRNDPQFYGGQTPFVQTGDVTRSNGRISQYTQTLNEKGVMLSKVFPKGTLLITIAANIGYSGILEIDAACPDSLIGIRSKLQLNNEYLLYCLTLHQKKMDILAPKGTQKNINLQFLKPWKIPLPSLPIQKQIAKILSAIDTKIQAEEAKKQSLETLFKTLLENLMTGKIRVPHLEIPS